MFLNFLLVQSMHTAIRDSETFKKDQHIDILFISAAELQ